MFVRSDSCNAARHARVMLVSEVRVLGSSNLGVKGKGLASIQCGVRLRSLGGFDL